MGAYDTIPDENFGVPSAYNGFTPTNAMRTTWGDQPQNYFLCMPWTGQNTLGTGSVFEFKDPATATGTDPSTLGTIFSRDSKSNACFVSSPSYWVPGTSPANSHWAYQYNSGYSAPSAYVDYLYAAVCAKVPETRRVTAYFGRRILRGSPSYPDLHVGVLFGVHHDVGTLSTYNATPAQDYDQVFTKDLSCFAVTVDRDRRLDGGTRKAYLWAVQSGTASLLDSENVPIPASIAGSANTTIVGALQVDRIDAFHGTSSVLVNVTMKNGDTLTLNSGIGGLPASFQDAGMSGVIMSPQTHDGPSLDDWLAASNAHYGPCCRRLEVYEASGGGYGDMHVDDFERDTNACAWRYYPTVPSGTYKERRWSDLSTIGMGTRNFCDTQNATQLAANEFTRTGLHQFSGSFGAQTALEIGEVNATGDAATPSRLGYGALVKSSPPDSEQQHRKTEITFTSSPGKSKAAGIMLRVSSALSIGEFGYQGQTALNVPHQYGVFDGESVLPYKQGYAGVIAYSSTALSWEFRILGFSDPSFGSGSALVTTLATHPLNAFGLSLGSAITLQFEAQNIAATNGNGSDFVRFRAVVNSTELTSYEIADDLLENGAVVSAVLGGNTWLFDQRPTAVTSVGTDGLLAMTEANVATDTNNKLCEFAYFNRLTPTDDQPGGNEVTLGDSIVFDSEHAASTGTLTIDLSWPVVESRSWPQNRQAMETGHMYAFARHEKARRRYDVQANNSTSAQRAALLTFYEDHNGTEIPFLWSPPSPLPGLTATPINVRFLTPNLGAELSDPGVESFNFTLEEVFDGS